MKNQEDGGQRVVEQNHRTGENLSGRLQREGDEEKSRVSEREGEGEESMIERASNRVKHVLISTALLNYFQKLWHYTFD